MLPLEPKMIVCHCRAVSDRVLREAIQRGHCSVEAVIEATGAGSRCGGCLASVHEIVDAELDAGQSVKAAYRPLRVLSDPRAA